MEAWSSTRPSPKSHAPLAISLKPFPGVPWFCLGSSMGALPWNACGQSARRNSTPSPHSRVLPSIEPKSFQGGRWQIIYADGGSVGAAGGGALPSMSLAELLDHFIRNSCGAGTSETTASSRPTPVQIVHPKISYPTGQLRVELVCYYSLKHSSFHPI